MSRRPLALLLTCEHGGARVPAALRDVLHEEDPRLSTHRGYDEGALAVAQALARSLRAPLVAATTTRLLVDLNRSAHNPRRFSEITRGLSVARREALMAAIFHPHRARVEAALAELGRGRTRVLHVAVHSFTPVLGRVPRDFDVGLLYDPSRPAERRLADAWARALLPLVHGVRRNAPYRGVTDGLTAGLRKLHPDASYAGIELELNQRRLVDGRFGPELVAGLGRTLGTVLRQE
ncbi:MAG: N-formylglutamate amidohydrolase [Myxococcales bacterium]|nr:N-formylglutamate amidohydrolase [Myxococcales bacterium]